MQAVDLFITDIANPGYGPIYAVHARGEDGKTYVFTDNRILTSEFSGAQRFLSTVRAKGEFNPDLWDLADRFASEAEREAYFGPGGDLWQWEEEEKAAGRW